jgi:hypothetical protein
MPVPEKRSKGLTKLSSNLHSCSDLSKGHKELVMQVKTELAAQPDKDELRRSIEDCGAAVIRMLRLLMCA